MAIYPLTPNLSWSLPEPRGKAAGGTLPAGPGNQTDPGAKSQVMNNPPSQAEAPLPKTAAAPPLEELLSLKAVIGFDEAKNTVVLFLDPQGQVVRQIPPEEYLDMLAQFQKNVESLFEKIA